MTHRDDEAELWALGALMEYDTGALLHAHPLTPGDFAEPARALVFRAIESLIAEGRPATLEAVTLRLRGTPVLADLMRACTGAIDARGWGPERFGPVVERLRELARARRLADHLRGQLAALDAARPDALALVRQSEDFARDLESGAVEVDRTGADDLLELADDWEHAGERPQRIPTGIAALDQAVGGWVPNINVLAGEPGALKSGVAAVAAWNQLQAGHAVGFVGLEEGTKFIQKRLIAERMAMRVGAVGTTRLHEYQQERLSHVMGEMFPTMQRLHVCSDATNPDRLVRVVRRWIATKGVRVVYIDHLGELEHRGPVRERYDLAIRSTLLALRPLALKHGVALVLVAHLNRESEGGRPKKHHLKESGYIEAMGRLILGCWSHERWPDRALVEVMKGNEVETGVTVWLSRKRDAALVDSAGGGVIDWNEVANERREQQRSNAGGWRSRPINGAGQD